MSWVIWLTGRPGSGKTTIANGVADGLKLHGVPVTVLDAAQLRRALLPESLGSEADEEIVHRALALVAALLSESGAAVIVDAAAPRRAWRALGRTLSRHFAEVQLFCEPELCAARQQAARWGIGCWPADPPEQRVPIASPDVMIEYEYSLTPELIVDTGSLCAWESVARVLDLALRLDRTAAANSQPVERRAS